MDTIKIFNFILGLGGQIAEDARKVKTSFEQEYHKILTVGTNNNSDPAVAIRETTESVFIFLEDLRLKLPR